MKIKELKKDNSLLSELRVIRNKISEELKGLTTEQIVDYLKTKKTLHPKNSFTSSGENCKNLQ
ncbi:MAG: hypothetical protein JSU03_09905 [Bacteroidetes bacterium]|nr:hypothetical protein [Bacteroidota bacterium]MBS1757581.1 hypothetical protein [Bacteroidota bacterium]